MENKTLESLNSSLFLLPTEALLQIKGGLLDGETRKQTWCDHQDHQDADGYVPDTETVG